MAAFVVRPELSKGVNLHFLCNEYGHLSLVFFFLSRNFVCLKNIQCRKRKKIVGNVFKTCTPKSVWFWKKVLYNSRESVKNACLFCGLHIDLNSKLPKKLNSVAKLFTSMVEIGQRAMHLPPTYLPPPPPSSEPPVLTANMGRKKQTKSMQWFQWRY